MLAAESELRFSLIESYFTDTRSQAKQEFITSDRSGYELDFDSYQVVTPQDPTAITSASTVRVSFVFTKADVVFVTKTSDLLSPLQILTGILSTVVSLFSVFAIIFSLSESYVLRRCCKRSSGRVRIDPVTRKHILDNSDVTLQGKKLDEGVELAPSSPASRKVVDRPDGVTNRLASASGVGREAWKDENPGHPVTLK